MDRKDNGSSRFEVIDGKCVIPDGVTEILKEEFEHCKDLREIVIPDGVTVIGESAFYCCKGLTSVTLPDSVRKIGRMAFYACENLSSVNIPDGVTEIPDSAFKYCESLREIALPDSVTAIEDFALYGCERLSAIELPSSLTKIGRAAFRKCYRLARAEIPSSVEWIGNGAFEECSKLSYVNIPGGVDELLGETFCDCTSLERVSIAEGVGKIGTAVFCRCTSLREVSLPASVTVIGGAAFKECSSLESVTLPANLAEMECYAFSGCSSLESIVIPESLKVIDEETFSGCTGLENAVIPDSVEKIKLYAFKGCPCEKDITYNIDYKWHPLTKGELIKAIRYEIRINGSKANLNCIDTSAITNMNGLFNNFKTFEGDIRGWNVSNVKDMSSMFEDSNFNGDIGRWDVSGAKDMSCMFKDGRFNGDISGWNVNNVKSYYPMFKGCDIPEENKPLRFRKRTMTCDEFISALPEALADVTDMAAAESRIRDRFKLVTEKTARPSKSVLIYRMTDGGVSVRQSKGQWSFDRYKGIIAEGGVSFADRVLRYTITGDGVCTIAGDLGINFPDRVRTTLFVGGEGLHTEAFFDRLVIAEGTTEIGSRVFSNWECLKEVSLPKSLQTLGDGAFVNCSKLEKVNFGSGLVKIGDGAFHSCSKIREIRLPKSLRTIGEDAFRYCKALESVEFPARMDSIGRNAFEDCKMLSGVKLPKLKEPLPKSAFCSRNFDLEVGDSTLQITVPCYAAGTAEATVSAWKGDVTGSLVIPSEVEYEGRVFHVSAIVDGAFRRCEDLREVWIPDGIEEIPANAFSGCHRLRRVHLGKKTREIGGHAFYECRRLREVELPDTVEVMGSGIFDWCENLLFVNRPAALKDVWNDVFYKTAVMDWVDGARYWGDIFLGFYGNVPPHGVLEVRRGTTLIAAGARCPFEVVILPSSVKYIGRMGLDDAKIVEVPWKKPIPTGEDVFDSKVTIRVPKGCLMQYQNDPEWGKYKLEEK